MRQFCLNTFVLSAAVIAVATYLPTTVARAQDMNVTAAAPGTSANAGMEVMTRGPIHEAFAQPVNSGGVSPLVVPKKPPEAIEEIPPDVKPADESAIWISGYWAWDDDQKDFNWVSGVWRVPPPGQRWVAGYWTEVPGGYSWVAGFWTPAEQQEVAYYPEPPASVEQGPTSDPPSPDYVWTSGCWRWMGGRYAWQPGFWAEARPDWVWVPASYYWSPRGWVFCDGYWDYQLDRRGLIFAPVHFTSAVYRRPGYFYSPSVVVDSRLLTFYLFSRPSYNHYYFGDYYAASYDGLGIFPWFAVRGHRGYAYDPLFAYYGWRNRIHDPNWARNLRDWHAYYRAHPDQRLPHNLASAQRIAAEGDKRPDRQFLKIADTLQDWRRRPDVSVPLATITAEQKSKVRETSRLMRQFGTERGRMEAERAAGAKTAIKTPETHQLPKVARTLTEGTPSRLEGSVRQTLKPVVPPPRPKRLEEMPREVRKPVVPPQLPERQVGPPRAQEKRAPEGRQEKVLPPSPRRTEKGDGDSKPRGGDKGAERGGRDRR